MGYAAPTKTWGDVVANVRRSFGDESGVQLEEGDLLRWINQGQYEIARQNKILKAKGVSTTMPGQSSYTLALGKPIMQIESVRCGDRRLVPTEFTTIDANLEEYPVTATGEPRLWYRWGDEVVIWPTPAAAEQLSIYFTAAPAAEASYDANKLLEITDEYFLPLIDFCMAKAHEMDDNPQSQEVSIKQYADRMTSMNDEERGGQSLIFHHQPRRLGDRRGKPEACSAARPIYEGAEYLLRPLGGAGRWSRRAAQHGARSRRLVGVSAAVSRHWGRPPAGRNRQHDIARPLLHPRWG